MSNSIEPIGSPGAAIAVRRITDMLDLMTQTLQQFSGKPPRAGADPLQQLAGLLMQVLGDAASLLGGVKDSAAGAGTAQSPHESATSKQDLALQASLLQMLGTLLKTVAGVLQRCSGQPLEATPAAQGLGQGLGQPTVPAAAGDPAFGPPAPSAPSIAPGVPTSPGTTLPSGALASPGVPTSPGAPPSNGPPAPTPAPGGPTITPAGPGDHAPPKPGTAVSTTFSIPDVGSGGDLSPSEIASRFGGEIRRASQASGIDPAILAGMIWQESKGRPETPNGGLMQVGPHEFETYGGGDIANPADNIMAGAMYMKHLKSQFGSTEAALRAYNSGPNGVDLNDLSATPKGTGDPTYIDKVLQAAEKSGL